MGGEKTVCSGKDQCLLWLRDEEKLKINIKVLEKMLTVKNQ